MLNAILNQNSHKVRIISLLILAIQEKFVNVKYIKLHLYTQLLIIFKHIYTIFYNIYRSKYIF